MKTPPKKSKANGIILILIIVAAILLGLFLPEKSNAQISTDWKNGKVGIGDIKGAKYIFSNKIINDLTEQVYNDYLEYCNEMFLDTVIQYGEVTTKLVPVYDGQGELIKYVYGNKSDTTWSLPSCTEYLRNDEVTSIGNIYWGGVHNNDMILYTGAISGTEREEKPDKFNYDIKRDFICKVKREKPGQNGFYDWLFELISSKWQKD